MPYPIRTIAAMTGVKPVTLRAWETRYGLLNPIRTESGHRLYTDADIETVQKALALRARGIPIRQVPDILANEDVTATEDEPWHGYRERMMTAIGNFEEPELDRIYQEVLGLYPITSVITDLIEPVLTLLGQRWDKVPGGIAEEHFFSTYVSHKLKARFQHQFGQATGPMIVCSCLPDEIHDLGLSLFCLAAHEANYRIINLGANTPLSHLEVVCRRRSPSAVVLAGLMTPANETLQQLRQLTTRTDSRVFVGGQASLNARAAIEAVGAVSLGTEPAVALRNLTQEIASQRPSREMESES